jgi:hypothetical protein
VQEFKVCHQENDSAALDVHAAKQASETSPEHAGTIFQNALSRKQLRGSVSENVIQTSAIQTRATDTRATRAKSKKAVNKENTT